MTDAEIAAAAKTIYDQLTPEDRAMIGRTHAEVLLVARLRSVRHTGRYEIGGAKIMRPLNPDGPEAADTIERLTRELAEARTMLETPFLAGYERGFYSAGNYFPDESWQRYLKALTAAKDGQ